MKLINARVRFLMSSVSVAGLLALIVHISGVNRGRLSVRSRSGHGLPTERALMSIVELTRCPLTRSESRAPLVRLPVTSGRLHVMLMGHSRMQQMYLKLLERSAMNKRTRHDPAPPLADQDDYRVDEGPPEHQMDNSTCLAAFPLPNYKVAHWRCSQAASNTDLLLDFRWRAVLPSLTSSLGGLLKAERQLLPDVLVVTNGLYLLPLWNGTVVKSWTNLIDMMDEARSVAEKLQQLQHRRVRVLWTLEQSCNTFSYFDSPCHQERINAINTVFQEMMILYGVPVWTSHLPLVADWVNTFCSSEDPLIPFETKAHCRSDQFHVDQRTIAFIAQQLWRFLSLLPSDFSISNNSVRFSE